MRLCIANVSDAGIGIASFLGDTRHKRDMDARIGNFYKMRGINLGSKVYFFIKKNWVTWTLINSKRSACEAILEFDKPLSFLGEKAVLRWICLYEAKIVHDADAVSRSYRI
ncbi:hypothetical protein MPSEU_000633500 [Mayamaea pseudoterrestris]|nr:hypothetical protein MPSEU_000633500 [Mayamaea pseudoterrestris]